MTFSFIIENIKHKEYFSGTFVDAIRRARAIDSEYQSAFVTKIEMDGRLLWDTDDRDALYDTVMMAFDSIPENADSDWSHPDAEDARKITAILGMTWDSQGWADAAMHAGRLVEQLIEEDMEERIAALPGGPQQVHSGWVWRMEGGREPFKDRTRGGLARKVLRAVSRMGVERAMSEP